MVPIPVILSARIPNVICPSVMTMTRFRSVSPFSGRENRTRRSTSEMICPRAAQIPEIKAVPPGPV